MFNPFKKPQAVELGCTYKDRITGFQGVATGFVQYISGCNQALLAPEVSADGGMRDPAWFDVQRLVSVDRPIVELDNSSNPGCDKAAPRR